MTTQNEREQLTTLYCEACLHDCKLPEQDKKDCLTVKGFIDDLFAAGYRKVDPKLIEEFME